MPRHFLFGADSYLGFYAIKPHFIPWIRAIGPHDLETNSKQHRFKVRIANEITGDLEVSLQSGSRLLIQSRRWKYHLSKSIYAPDVADEFGGAYLTILTERFFEHLKADCSCFGSTTTTTSPSVTKRQETKWGT